MTVLIGYNISSVVRTRDYITMFFRDSRGFKYRMAGYLDSMTGAKDLCLSCGVPVMSDEQYEALPEKIESETVINH